MPLYTRKGDKGTTGLLGGSRVPKSDLIIDLLGTIDEVDAALGVARSQCGRPESCTVIFRIQKDLWQLMGDIASLYENPEKQRSTINEEHVRWLEEQIAVLEQSIAAPKGFIVPGDSYPAALLDVARTVARRAERRMVTFLQDNLFHNPHILQYLNRLSSVCYALELYELSFKAEGSGAS